MKAVPPPSLAALREHIDSLPFDVLLRRIHSSSQRNPARSLEAHFIGVRFCQAHGKRQQQAEPSRTCGETLAPALLGTAESVVAASSSQLRELLSERLLQDVRQPRARLQLNLGDLSLILANAVRHKFSFQLTHATLRLLTDALNGAKGKDTASQQIEALSRVMEACCGELGGCALLTWDDLASLVAMVEQRWSLFTKSDSLCCLLIQFFTTIIAVELPAEAPAPGLFKADPILLKNRCLQLVRDLTDVLVGALNTGAPLAWSFTELQGMCAAVQRLSHYETARGSSRVSSSERVRFWKRAAVPGPAEIADSAPPAHKQMSRLVTTQVLSHSRLASDVQAMTLEQVAGVFSSVSSACGAEAILRFAVPVQKVLRRAVTADAASMRQVICIAEASLHVEGASLLFVEAIRSIRRFAFVLTSGAAWDLLSSVCVLLESAPLSLRAAVVECLGALQNSLEKSQRLPSSVAPEFASFRIAAVMLGALLVQRGVPTTPRMEDILHGVVEAAPLLHDSGERGASVLARCCFMLAYGRPPANAERRARALRMAVAEASQLLGEGVGGHSPRLTSAERSMLRNSFKQFHEIMARAGAERPPEAQRVEDQQPALASRQQLPPASPSNTEETAGGARSDNAQSKEEGTRARRDRCVGCESALIPATQAQDV
ncbi:hypothetical protein TraAM80_09120 [Trypanosoma rangeli]|uniref:Uncharacterized protein n=1 Tax=Trypanosoma rangeli TaxID=5698 RepID=A0A3R7JZ90_TRYRA|nr:uncharacterized protein TraAM80_09120 [Trypanosoma rangeli]RNE97827.1 hypothetical protein TraAM80_09120 [Trypanosoma rangeli]|eukprot:RNE97827.1 hypothetical protein TraAM80_09120 [Trypanosoma rangeli]